MVKDSILKEEDLISGVCYLWKYDIIKYIMYYKGNNESFSEYIRISTAYYSRSGSFRLNDPTASIPRRATSKEKAHLDACIEANGYVEPPTIVELYKIY